MDCRLKAILPLCLAQMFKFFSHYGVRAIFVLYLVQKLRFSDSNAFGLNAVFIGLVELGGIFGGMLADRYLGLRRATFIGACLLVAGYFVFVFEAALFLAMGLVIAGGSLFSSNITALVGAIYEEGDPQRERGFTIFYMVQNLGALVSMFLCSIVAGALGFRAGFVCASTGMVLALVILCFYHAQIRQLGAQASQQKGILTPLLGIFMLLGIGTLCLYFYEGVLQILPGLTVGVFGLFALFLLQDPCMEKRNVCLLLVYLGALVLFFAIQDQICSSLILFSERVTGRFFFGWKIPSTLITCINPIVIIALGTVFVGSRVKLWVPFLITSSMFVLLGVGCLLNIDVTIFGVMMVVVAISAAELMLGPMVTSFASEVAAAGRPGMVMGIVPIAYSLAFQLSALVGQLVAVEDQTSSVNIYGTGFLIVALILFGGGLLFQLLLKRFSDEKYCLS